MSYIIRDRVALPNVFLLSPPRTATTSLADWLNQHPDICVSDRKEPRYLRSEYHLGSAYYSYKYFKHYGGEHVIADMAPGNFGALFTAPRMFETNPNAKLIVIVRNRWQRALSEYNMFRRLRPGRARETFSDELHNELHSIGNNYHFEPDYVRNLDNNGETYDSLCIHNSCYADKIKYWMRWFGPERFVFIYFDNLINRKEATISFIYNFLGIDFHFQPSFKQKDMVAVNEKDTFEYAISNIPLSIFSEVDKIFRHDDKQLQQIWSQHDFLRY